MRKVTHARRRNAWMDRWIVTNLYTGVGVHDVITCADLYYDCLRGLGVTGGQILAFSIDLLRRPYNTLALPCECVIDQWNDSRNCLCSLVSNPDHTSYYHCWAGCECATSVQFFKVTELLCLVGNKSDSSGKYYSSPVRHHALQLIIIIIWNRTGST